MITVCHPHHRAHMGKHVAIDACCHPGMCHSQPSFLSKKKKVEALQQYIEELRQKIEDVEAYIVELQQ